VFWKNGQQLPDVVLLSFFLIGCKTHKQAGLVYCRGFGHTSDYEGETMRRRTRPWFRRQFWIPRNVTVGAKNLKPVGCALNPRSPNSVLSVSKQETLYTKIESTKSKCQILKCTYPQTNEYNLENTCLKHNANLKWKLNVMELINHELFPIHGNSQVKWSPFHTTF